jgi:hypothetical protein
LEQERRALLLVNRPRGERAGPKVPKPHGDGVAVANQGEVDPVDANRQSDTE